MRIGIYMQGIILGKIKRLPKNRYILLIPLFLSKLGYAIKLLVDQIYVKTKSGTKLVRFRTSIVHRLGILDRSFSTQKERINNLRAVVDCLESAKIDYFVIPDNANLMYKVGISAKNKNKFLKELSRVHGDSGLYISSYDTLHNRFTQRQIISSFRSLKTHESSDIVRVYSFKIAPNSIMLAGENDGCDIEFWESNDNESRSEYLIQKLEILSINVDLSELKNTLVAPITNNFTAVLPLDEVKKAKIEIDGKQYSTYDVFTKKTTQDIDFPIDIVYAWVDGSDPVWLTKFNKYKGVPQQELSARNNTEARYKDREELKYSLRSVYMYAPFVRNIYIVTDQQVPSWLNTNDPRVRIVDHKEIFSDPSVLPVFNSHAIGAQIHNIKGLSDRYLYLNDDMLFGKLTTPQKFFYGNGLAKVPGSRALIHAGEPKNFEPAPSSAGKNVRRAIEETFGIYLTNKYRHSPNPQIKEVSQEIESKYPELVRRTIESRFRNKTDVQFASQFHHSYALVTGRAVLSGMKSAVVNISSEDANRALHELLKQRDAHTICLNESETPDSRKNQVEEMVQNFLEQYYPFPSPWEK